MVSKTCWFSSFSDSSMGILVDDIEHTDFNNAIDRVVDALGLAINIENEDSEPLKVEKEYARALFAFKELVPVLGVVANTAQSDSQDIMAQKMKTFFLEKNWTGPLAEGPVLEIIKLFFKFHSELSLNKASSAYNVMKDIQEKSTTYFGNIKQFSQRAIFTKFMIFAFIYSTCFDQYYGTFMPLVKLSKQELDDIIKYIKTRIKSLFDTVKRRSTIFFSGSIKNKHQDLMDDILQCVYPMYSVCKGFTNPYTTVLDSFDPWSEEKIEIQIDPQYLPSSEDRPVLLQVGLVLMQDTLVPLFVYLWRDMKSLYLRRQSTVFKFMITHGGPNSILQISIGCDRIKSKNTLHPTEVSSTLPFQLVFIDQLFKDFSASCPSISVYKEMSSVGEIHLQALGVDVNVQNSLGQTVLHLAVLHGHAEIVESLLQCGAQRHLLDNSGLTPIMIAVLEVENMESEEVGEKIVALLADGDSRLDLPDTSGIEDDDLISTNSDCCREDSAAPGQHVPATCQEEACHCSGQGWGSSSCQG
jgi:hypothetical protein